MDRWEGKCGDASSKMDNGFHDRPAALRNEFEVVFCFLLYFTVAEVWFVVANKNVVAN